MQRTAPARLSLPAAEAGDTGALLRWQAAHLAHSPRLLDRGLAADGAPWRVSSGAGAASQGTNAGLLMATAAAGVMPDVNGDGVDDVFQVDYSPRRYLARDGRTGRVLWQRDASHLHNAEYARLGRPARPALVAQAVTTVDGVDRTGVEALDARTGAVLWTTSSPSAEPDVQVGYAALDETYLAGVTPRAGQADQVVLGTISGVVGLVGAAAAVTPGTLDGASGATLTTGTPLVADDVPWVSALPDLTGDGQGDVVVTANGNERQTALYDGATGTLRWLKVSPDGGQFGSYAELLPRADAGRPAVLVEAGGFDGGALTAYTGSGDVLWSLAGLTGDVTADGDRDGVPDVLSIGFTDTGLEVVGLSGRTGRTRFRSAVALPDTGSGGASISGGPAGDLTGDGVTDVLFELDTTGSHPRHDAVVVDGRTGSRRSYPHLAGVPVGARLAGRGAALLDAVPTDRQVTLLASTLQQRLWTTQVAARKVVGLWFVDYGRLTTATRTADVLASLYGSGGSDIVALRGTTGQVLWRVHV